MHVTAWYKMQNVQKVNWKSKIPYICLHFPSVNVPMWHSLSSLSKMQPQFLSNMTLKFSSNYMMSDKSSSWFQRPALHDKLKMLANILILKATCFSESKKSSCFSNSMNACTFWIIIYLSNLLAIRIPFLSMLSPLAMCWPILSLSQIAFTLSPQI